MRFSVFPLQENLSKLSLNNWPEVRLLWFVNLRKEGNILPFSTSLQVLFSCTELDSWT